MTISFVSSMKCLMIRENGTLAKEKCFTAHEKINLLFALFLPFQISWIRYKDTSLLTVGRYTYTTDLRFEAFHSPHTDDWVVRLKNPQPSDSGIYGCQISTTPHRTQLVYLTVHGKIIFVVLTYLKCNIYVSIGGLLIY